MWIASSQRCREIDRLAEQDYGFPASFLMERAGIAVFDAVKEMLPEGGRLTVVCGRGKNGGDGFVTARAAFENGYNVECLVAGEEEDLNVDASNQMKIMRGAGLDPVFSNDSRWVRKLECLKCRELIVDALLGTGLKNPVKGVIKDAIQAINRSGVPAIAVDIPSGIDCDTGEELGESVWALRTIAIGSPKPGLFEGIGLEHAGYWSVADIGYPAALMNEPTDAKLLTEEWVSHLLPERLRRCHKGDAGSVLIVAGSHRMPGAAIMAALGAMRAGSGLVTIASIQSVCDAVVARVPEAILIPLPERNGSISPDAASLILEHVQSFSSAIFGPGLGSNEGTKTFLSELWKSWNLPSVIDADAISLVSDDLAPPQGDCVFTPHPGEMGRLMKASVAEIQSDRFKSVRQAANKLKKCMILKGAHTLITEPDQPILVNQTGNSGMASAGMGDVLSGVVGTLLAQDLPPYYAAACGVYWHGAAGDSCAREIGSIGFTATEVADHLPRARAKITSV